MVIKSCILQNDETSHGFQRSLIVLMMAGDGLLDVNVLARLKRTGYPRTS